MMRGAQFLSSRVTKILGVVAGTFVIFLVDLACRTYGAALSGLDREEKMIKEKWEYASRLLARSQNIEERYQQLNSSFPKYIEGGQDPDRLMAELDEVAKTAGVQLTALRPQPSYARVDQKDNSTSSGIPDSRIEMAFHGSWSQVARFFQAAEDRDHLFTFSDAAIRRQEPTGELAVSATARK